MKYEIWKSIVLNSKDKFREIEWLAWISKDEIASLKILLWNFSGCYFKAWNVGGL